MAMSGTQWAVFAISTVLLLVGLRFEWLQVARQTIDWELTYSRPFLGSREGVGNIVRVLIDGNEPPEPHVVAVKIGNFGKRAVRLEDFESSIRLRLDNCWIIRAYITQPQPVDVSPRIEIDPERQEYVAVEPLLLNPGDSFEIQAFTNGGPDRVRLEGRVANVSTFRDRAEVRRRRAKRLNYLIPVGWILFVLWIWSLGVFANFSFQDWLPWTIGTAMGAWAVFYNSRHMYTRDRRSPGVFLWPGISALALANALAEPTRPPGSDCLDVA